ncbi:hypothetical protein EQG41_15415 [Billgrantia azerbaijanica]|nr:hypothetical protein EQG41_15415 [Halomonas azerbaijanica]
MPPSCRCVTSVRAPRKTNRTRPAGWPAPPRSDRHPDYFRYLRRGVPGTGRRGGPTPGMASVAPREGFTAPPRWSDTSGPAPGSAQSGHDKIKRITP